MRRRRGMSTGFLKKPASCFRVGTLCGKPVPEMNAIGTCASEASCSISRRKPQPSRTGMFRSRRISAGRVPSRSIASAASRLRAPASTVALSGVTVRVVQTGGTAVTDGSGAFTISRVPTGPVDLTFERPDIHAQGNVMVPSAAPLQLTVSIVGNKAVITPGGHAGAEIEGLVTSVDVAGSSLVIADERLGSVTVPVTATTVIPHRQTPVALASIAAGNRVPGKAMQGP